MRNGVFFLVCRACVGLVVWARCAVGWIELAWLAELGGSVGWLFDLVSCAFKLARLVGSTGSVGCVGWLVGLTGVFYALR